MKTCAVSLTVVFVGLLLACCVPDPGGGGGAPVRNANPAQPPAPPDPEAEAKREERRKVEAESRRVEREEREARWKRETVSKYNQVSIGMTYDEVFAVLGVHGTELSRVEIGGNQAVVVMWQNKDSFGGNMNVTFQNGRVAVKAQFGLR